MNRERLISRLRTGYREIQIRCRCKGAKKDVAHILLTCSLTKHARSKAQKALGVKALTIIILLYEDKGAEWAEEIWQAFIETMG